MVFTGLDEILSYANEQFEYTNKQSSGSKQSFHHTDTGPDNSDMPFTLTEEQKQIIFAPLLPKAPLKVIAFAGTGKTTTASMLASAHEANNILYITFNKAAQLDAERYLAALESEEAALATA